MAVAFSVAICFGSSLRAAHAARKLPRKHAPGVAEFLVAAKNCGRLVARMHHAIFAAWILAASVFGPVRVREKFLEVRMVRVGHHVARTFPASRVVGRRGPGRAFQFAFAAQIFKIEWRSHDVVAAEKLGSALEFM